MSPMTEKEQKNDGKEPQKQQAPGKERKVGAAQSGGRIGVQAEIVEEIGRASCRERV